jgi:hypothetical protein
MTANSADAFGIDIRRDLERVDSVMTQVLGDPATVDEFVRDPSGVLARLGLHPRASREVHDRVNKIFYAVLTNTDLVDYVLNHFANFDGPIEDNENALNEGLARGVVNHSMELDLAAADHVFRQPDVMRQVYRLTLHDLNNRRLLQGVYTPEQLDDYVEQVVGHVQQRAAIRDEPRLETWDEYYGVGTGYGVGEAEVGPVATLGIGVEVAVAVTVVIPVGFLGVAPRPQTLADAARGNPEAIRTLATAAALLRLAGEVLVHANNFAARPTG